jgi:hypothetical protein
MFTSLRRIGNTLLVVSVLSLSLTFLSSLTVQCAGTSSGCLAALFFGIEPVEYLTDFSDFSIAQTTIAVPSEGVGFVALIQLVSAYGLLVAVGILIILELFELYYIRKFLRFRKMRRQA